MYKFFIIKINKDYSKYRFQQILRKTKENLENGHFFVDIGPLCSVRWGENIGENFSQYRNPGCKDDVHLGWKLWALVQMGYTH